MRPWYISRKARIAASELSASGILTENLDRLV